MSSSVSNKVYAGNPQFDGAQAPVARAHDGPVAKIPANDDAAVEAAPADDEAVDAEAATAEILEKGGGGGGNDDDGDGGGGGEWIKVTMPDIAYSDEAAGYLQIDDDGKEPLSPRGGTVLRLLCYLTYTREGRTLLLDNAVDKAATRAKLRGALQKKFPALEIDRLEIALDAHFAAGDYVLALEAGEREKMGQLQDIYRQRLLAILGALYDDAMGRDFSCVW